MQSLKFAFKNVFRNRRRSVTTILIAAIGTAAMVSAAGFVLYAYQRLTELSTRESGHILLAHRNFFDKEEEKPMEYGLPEQKRLLRDLRIDKRVRGVLPRIQFSGLISNGDNSTIFIGTAVDPKEFQFRGPFLKIIDGTTLSDSPDPKQDSEVMLGKELAHILNAKAGSSLTLISNTTQNALNAVDVRVRGVFSVGVPEMDKRLAYVDLGTAQELLRTNKVSTLSLYLLETDQTKPVMTDVSARYPDLAVKPWWDLAFYYKAVRALYNRLFSVLGIILLSLVFFSVSNTMSMSVLERTRETGTLAALGAYPHELVRNFLLEALVIGGIGVIAGMALGASLSALLDVVGIQMPAPPGRSDTYPLNILISAPIYAGASFLVLTTCVIAAYFAARRGVKKPIIEALAYV